MSYSWTVAILFLSLPTYVYHDTGTDEKLKMKFSFNFTILYRAKSLNISLFVELDDESRETNLSDEAFTKILFKTGPFSYLQ